jgi:hypothetical protein
MVDSGGVHTEDINTACEIASLLYYGYYSRVTSHITPEYFVPSTSKFLGAHRGLEAVSYSGKSGTYYELVDYMSRTDNPDVNKIYLENWSVDSKDDIFNQLHNKFMVEDKLTLTIGNKTETKTIDQWLQYFLKVLLKELKYERDYNKTLKQKI